MAAVGAAVVAGLLLTSYAFYPGTLRVANDTPTRPAGEIGGLPIVQLPVVGEADQTGRIQVDLGQEAEERYNLAGVDGGEEGSHL